MILVSLKLCVKAEADRSATYMVEGLGYCEVVS